MLGWNYLSTLLLNIQDTVTVDLRIILLDILPKIFYTHLHMEWPAGYILFAVDYTYYTSAVAYLPNVCCALQLLRNIWSINVNLVVWLCHYASVVVMGGISIIQYG